MTRSEFLQTMAGAAMLPTVVDGPMKLPVRRRVAEGSKLRTVNAQRDFEPSKTAVVLCDVWDLHWCKSAAYRCGLMAPRINEVCNEMRAKGAFIIHAPSDTMEFYKEAPQRLRLQNGPKAALPKNLEIPDPPLPIDDSDGGCDDQPQCRNYRAWKRQHPAIAVADQDGVSDRGDEIYSAINARGIETVLLMGVHTNMCVLHRSFAIKQMTRWRMPCILVRDLTDTMYNPRMRPFVEHSKGTQLVIEFIEQNWCPTTTSGAVLKALKD